MSLRCDIHDYIEVMCLYRYEVRLTLSNKTHITAIFHDTGFITNKGSKLEAIFGHDSDNGEPINVPLTKIETIKVITPNNHFSQLALI